MTDSPRVRNSRSPSYKRGLQSKSPSPHPKMSPRGRSQSKSPSPFTKSPSQVRHPSTHRSHSRSVSPRPRSLKRSPQPRPHSPSPHPKPRSRGRSPSRSPSPRRRSFSRSRSRSRSRTRIEAANPGNALYVTGLSSRVTEKGLEDHLSKEGKVVECHLMVEPRSRISRGFAFITMDTNEDAERCIKYLNHSVLEGRHITVERSKRKRPRTPTPGNYRGLKNARDSYRGSYRGGYGREYYGGSRRSPRRSPYRRDYSPRRSPYYDGRSRRDRSRSPLYSSYRSPERGSSYAR